MKEDAAGQYRLRGHHRSRYRGVQVTVQRGTGVITGHGTEGYRSRYRGVQGSSQVTVQRGTGVITGHGTEGSSQVTVQRGHHRSRYRGVQVTVQRGHHRSRYRGRAGKEAQWKK